jgi:hypothetical protein
MKIFFNNCKYFIQSTLRDSRIPLRDKRKLSVISAILAVRVLIKPDWIPYFGILDILFLTGIILDYFFHVLDQNLLLSHYPWGMKSFARLRRIASFLSLFSPGFIKDNLWDYTKDPF